MRSLELQEAIDEMHKLKRKYSQLIHGHKFEEGNKVLQESIVLNKKISQLFDAEEGD